MPPPSGPPRSQQRQGPTHVGPNAQQQMHLTPGTHGTAIFIPTGGATPQPLQLALHITININGTPQSPGHVAADTTRQGRSQEQVVEEDEVPTVPPREMM